MRHSQRVVVIGAGLAGSEAAWQIASQGIEVDLYEMRPTRHTEAHTTSGFAELVCSNSLGSNSPNSASRILKEELTQLGAFVLAKAFENSVPAGASLAVDRQKFSDKITQTLESHPKITVRREELAEIPRSSCVVIASGPLTSPALAKDLTSLAGTDSLYFYDAISPIVSTESLDQNEMFTASRYGKGEPDFLNIPLTQAQYENFVEKLIQAEVVLAHDFEEEKYFESCLPIETLASRGKLTLAFGPMKPVGLTDPKTGKRAFAVIQLRAENRFLTAYNLVGFQTKMKYKEQERIFRELPGLRNAEFLRLGSMHRNTYLDSPRVLTGSLQLRNEPGLFIAGQITGTEGYLESSATGLLAGLNAARHLQGKEPLVLPNKTILGALVEAITDPKRSPFQPMNVNMGLFPPLGETQKFKDKQKRNAAYAGRSKQELSLWLSQMGLVTDHPELPHCTPPNPFPEKPSLAQHGSSVLHTH